MKPAPIAEAQLDAMANDGRLSSIALWLAIDAGVDWASLSDDEQDEWHETAIRRLRTGKVARGYLLTVKTKRPSR